MSAVTLKKTVFYQKVLSALCCLFVTARLLIKARGGHSSHVDQIAPCFSIFPIAVTIRMVFFQFFLVLLFFKVRAIQCPVSNTITMAIVVVTLDSVFFLKRPLGLFL